MMKKETRGRKPINWDKIAKLHGYNNPRVMLEDLYQKNDLRQISIILKVSHYTTWITFQKLGIATRKRGQLPPGIMQSRKTVKKLKKIIFQHYKEVIP